MLNVKYQNKTKISKFDYVIFNRVPKVGSQSLMFLMKDLGQKLGFNVTRDTFTGSEQVVLSEPLQYQCVSDIMKKPLGSIYVKHTAFINLKILGYNKPIYINLVRDPIERIISWYHYVRAPWYYVEMKILNEKLPLPDPQWLKKDFEECVLDPNDSECKFIQGSYDGNDHRRQILFFCGHNLTYCMPFNSYEAMQTAKQNVEKEYAVVGTFEETNITLTVLEHYLPRYFKGAKEIYYKNQRLYGNKNRNNYKPIISEEIKNILRKNMTNEIEFYEFCKQRLYKQYLALIEDKVISEI